MAKPSPLSLLLENLSHHLAKAPANKRDVTGAMLCHLAHFPENYEVTAEVLSLLMKPPATKPEPDTKVTHLRMVQKGGAA